jgi:hypothetical protein
MPSEELSKLLELEKQLNDKKISNEDGINLLQEMAQNDSEVKEANSKSTGKRRVGGPKSKNVLADSPVQEKMKPMGRGTSGSVAQNPASKGGTAANLTEKKQKETASAISSHPGLVSAAPTNKRGKG